MRFQLLPLRNDRTSVNGAATTISLAFSKDPLIQWLRPKGRPWGDLDKSSTKWQQRRVQKAIYDGFMFRLVPTTLQDPIPKPIQGDDGLSFGSASPQTMHSSRDDLELNTNGAIAILEPPVSKRHFSFHRIFGNLKIWLLNTIDPVDDSGDIQRIGTMMESHTRELRQLTQQLHPKHVWYLEVIAVHPSLHGRGLGGQLMRSITEYAGDDPIVLECTEKSNIGFYRKFGFEVMKNIQLADDGSYTATGGSCSEDNETQKDKGHLEIWLMLKQ